jgi:hypothetical protein
MEVAAYRWYCLALKDLELHRPLTEVCQRRYLAV